MATCSLVNLSVKMAFLVASTSGQRVGETGALMAEVPFTVFFKDKVSLCPYPQFYSRFHLSFISTKLSIPQYVS